MEDMWLGGKIRLRAPTMDDLDGYFAHQDGRNSESQRSGDRVHFPVSREQRRERLEGFAKQNPMGAEYFLIMEDREGRAVGNINTHSIDRFAGTFAFGIGVLPEHRGKGFASEAIRLLLRYFFNELGFQKCNTSVYAFNPDSVRLHERFGFMLEGRLRRNHFANGEYCDVLSYGITREEFWEKHGKSST